MANDKDFILKNAIEVGGSTKVTIGDAPASGSYAVGYDLSNATYDNVSSSIAEGGAQYGIAYKSDGTRFYFIDNPTTTGYQYNLTTGWDVSTMSYANKSFNFGNQDGGALAIGISSDGTKMYMIGYSNDRVYQYTLSTPYELNTASYDSVSFSVVSQVTNARGLSFKSDGTRMYIGDTTSETIFQYSLSTAWDVSTASYDSVSLDVSTQTTAINSSDISQDGKYIVITGSAGSDTQIYQYLLSTAWDLSTASHDSTLTVTAFGGPLSAWYNNDGSKLFYSSYIADAVYQFTSGSTVATATFDTSTGNYFTHTPSADAEYGFSNAGDVQTFQLEVTGNQSVVPYSVSGTATTGSTYATTQGNSAGSIGLFVKPDGTKMYHSDYVSNKVYQHSLSTAWDLSTASYDGSSNDLSVSSQADYPNSIFFKSDGTRLYVAGSTTNRVFEYALSTAWDLSSASYSQQSNNFSSQTSNAGPHTLAFKPDGTKMYLSQTSSRIVYQYSLSTAWDTTSATYDSVSFSYTTFAPGSTYIYFKSDGTKLYLNGSNNGDLYEVDLSTAWDLSTASYNNVSHDYADGFSSNISIKPDGTKFFSITYSPASLMREYSMTASTPITITWDADIEWGGGTAPSSPASGQKDLYTITTDDGGTTYFGVPSGVAFS